jgi:EpsI family protein
MQDALEIVEKIPKKLDHWQGHDFPLEELIYDILETRSIIHRNYQSNDKNVFLSVVYYPETKVDFHAPESCLAGQGVEINKSRKKIKINYMEKNILLDVNTIIRRNNYSKELIYYFYKTGEFIGYNYIKLRIKLAFTKLVGKPTAGSLIRISTPLNSSDSAEKVLSEFIETLYPFIIDNL